MYVKGNIMEYVFELWRRPKSIKDRTTTIILRWERANSNIYSCPEYAKEDAESSDYIEWHTTAELLDGESGDYDYRIKAKRIINWGRYEHK
jgi:hypothetical protein